MENITFEHISFALNIILAVGILLIQLRHNSKMSKANFDNQMEVEKLKLSYTKEIEILKREQEVEVDKKKKRYEGKLQQYKHYYKIIDEYSSSGRINLFNRFKSGVMDLIQNPSPENTQKYISSIFEIMGDSNDQFLKIKNEISGLKLEAGLKLLELLKEYELKLKDITDLTNKFVTDFNTSLQENLFNAQNVYQELYNKYFSDSLLAKDLKNIQDEIFLEMRSELGNYP